MKPSTFRPRSFHFFRLLFPIAMGLALGLATGIAAAESSQPDSCLRDCHGSNIECHQTVREESRACRSACSDTIRAAIDDARAECELEGIEGSDCRERVVTAARAAGEGCRPDCREAKRDSRKACRQEARSCGETCRGPIDETCAEDCRVEFQPCLESLRECRHGCHGDRRAAFEACRENSADRGEFRECVRQAHAAVRECNLDCHDENLCGEAIRTCMEGCVIEDEF